MAPKKVSLEELKEWRGVGEAAAELGLSRQGVRDMLNEGRALTGVKTRIGWLVEPNALYEQAKRDAAIRNARRVARQAREVGR